MKALPERDSAMKSSVGESSILFRTNGLRRRNVDIDPITERSYLTV